MTLYETIELMKSDDHQDRFRAEYYQLMIRYCGLKKMINDWDAGTLIFEPDCPRRTYDLQLKYMENYLSILVTRAAIEGIILDEIEQELELE